jgi:hypothetical protein
MASTLMLAVALLGPRFAFAQAPSFDELIRKLENMEEQDLGRFRSADLIEPLKTLALRHQEDGSHAVAAALIERALEVIRVNYGLHSLEQAPVILQSIDIEQARDNHGEVWALEQVLLNLARRHPHDLATVTVLREIADRRMDSLQRYIAGDYLPEIVIGCYYQYRRLSVVHEGCTSGSKGVAARNLLLDARKYYEDAIAVFRHHELYSSDELRELEMKLIRINYFYGDGGSPLSRYEHGKDSFRRLIHYDVESSALLSQIDSLVQLADWELMHSNNALALNGYRHAYELLAREDVPRESIEQLFSPKTPTVLPAFLPNPLVSVQTPQSTGFVDAAFAINRYGKSRHIEILDTTSNASKTARRRLTRLISLSRFRPRTQDGRFDGKSRVVLRYYLNE